MPTWPLQKDCNTFYGNPSDPKDKSRASAAWEAANLVYVKAPFRMTYDGKPLSKGLRVHKKCAESLKRILDALWVAAGKKQATVDLWGVSITAGGHNYRLKRGGSTLSMHSWGCAVDFDPARNGMGDTTPNLARYPQVLQVFADEGWEWGGNWSGKSCDGMHIQASWTRANAVKPGVPVAVPKPTSAPKPVVTPKPPVEASVIPSKPVPVEIVPVEPHAGITIPRKIPGSKNDPVVFYVQHVLDEKGWHEVGTVDGLMGTRTQGAILMFRNEQEPTLEPLTGTIDQELVNSLEIAQERKVSITRATTTATDLAQKGDETILTAENAQKALIGAGAFTSVGAGDQQGWIDKAKANLDGFGVIKDIGDRVLDAVQWSVQNWPWFALGAIAYLVWKNRKVISQRVEDHRTGKNLAL